MKLIIEFEETDSFYEQGDFDFGKQIFWLEGRKFKIVSLETKED